VPDSLAPEVVEPLLRGRFGRPYRYAEVAASTQCLLRSHDPEGSVAVAKDQTEEKLPGETQTPPASLRLEAGRIIDRAALLTAILLGPERAYDAWVTETSASG
jgi:hypothetical protein